MVIGNRQRSSCRLIPGLLYADYHSRTVSTLHSERSDSCLKCQHIAIVIARSSKRLLCFILARFRQLSAVKVTSRYLPSAPKPIPLLPVPPTLGFSTSCTYNVHLRHGLDEDDCCGKDLSPLCGQVGHTPSKRIPR